MLDSAKLQKRHGSYFCATVGAVTDKILLDVAVAYHNQIGPRFEGILQRDIAKRFPENATEKLLETTKYDGEGVFIYFEAARSDFPCFAFNAPSGRVRVGLPCLVDLRQKLAAAGVSKALLRGELYVTGQRQGKRYSSADVVRISFSGTEAETATLRLAVFDIIMLDGKDMRDPADFLPAWEQLGTLCGVDDTRLSHRAAGKVIREGDVAGVFTTKTGAGAEGLVLRRLNRLELIKVKPQLTIDAVVVGFVEGEFEGSYGVLSLLTALTYGQSTQPTHYQVLARVGSGFTDQLRLDLLATLAPDRVPAPLAMTDSDGRTIHFVKPRLIVELQAHDIVTATRNDRDNTTQLLVAASGGAGWTFAGLTAFPRLLFPTLSRLREDKELSTGGARVHQVLPHNEGPPSTILAEERKVAVLRREVWTKTSKGETMVRKLLLARVTGDAESFPFLVYWTDFSAKRKDPLQVDLACAATEVRAHALAAKFIADGVGKGWEKVL